MIPQDYPGWRRCIEHDCGIALTQAFARERLAELRQPGHERTAQFIRLYGEEHWRRVVGWFAQVAGDG
jgi:hypothetical protein